MIVASDILASLAGDTVHGVRRVTVLLLVLGAPWWPSVELDAAVHVCRAANGTTVYQDRPCARTTFGVAGDDARARRPPAGMHPSWFEHPSGSRASARCDERGCECGTLSRRFEGGLTLALSDALYIDGAWLRYEIRQATLGDVTGSDTLARARRLELHETVCDVLMSQETLRRYTEQVFGELRSRRRAAEARGFDTPTACDEGDTSACAYHEDVVLYGRMLTDLDALRRPRDASDATADRL